MARRKWIPPELYKELCKDIAKRKIPYTCFSCGEKFPKAQHGEVDVDVVITREPTTGRVLNVTCKHCKTLGLDKLTMFPSLPHHHPLPHRVSEALPPVTKKREYYDPKENAWVRPNSNGNQGG
jgi:hypothetical protein